MYFIYGIPPKYLYIYLYEYIYICEKLDVMILLDDESEPRVSR